MQQDRFKPGYSEPDAVFRSCIKNGSQQHWNPVLQTQKEMDRRGEVTTRSQHPAGNTDELRTEQCEET